MVEYQIFFALIDYYTLNAFQNEVVGCFVVAHFHYVLSLGGVYSIFAAFYHWFGVINGMGYADLQGRLHFISFFSSSNFIFIPHHVDGYGAHPRRIYD